MGTNNDLNVFGVLPIFNFIMQGKAHNFQYVVNGNEYKFRYYLGDVIYLEYVMFVRSEVYPQDEKSKFFKLA